MALQMPGFSRHMGGLGSMETDKRMTMEELYAKMAEKEERMRALLKRTRTGPMLTDADVDALLRIPMVDSVEHIPEEGYVSVHLHEFDTVRTGDTSGVYTITVRKGARIVVSDDSGEDMQYRVIVHGAADHRNIMGLKNPCWGNIEDLAHTLIQERRYAELIAVTCEFLKCYTKAEEAHRMRVMCAGGCDTCRYYQQNNECAHPGYNVGWRVPTAGCIYWTQFSTEEVLQHAEQR